MYVLVSVTVSHGLESCMTGTKMVGLAHFPFIWDNHLAICRYVGKIWDGRETANPRSSGIFPTYEN